MKRFVLVLVWVLLIRPPLLQAQDPAQEERLNKLGAQIQDLIEAQGVQNRRIEALAKELQTLEQEQQSRPVVNYATQDEVKELAAKLKEVDRKRQEDNDHILEELRRLGKNLSAGMGRKPAPNPHPTDEAAGAGPATPQKGFYYTVKKGDYLEAIVRAYAENNIKVTVAQIVKANPGLKAETLYVGKKIFIPAPQ